MISLWFTMPIADSHELAVPDFFDPATLERPAQIPYRERAPLAREWAMSHGVTPAADDRFRIGLLCIDVQNTFCLPESELFVGSSSGRGPIDDNHRLCAFMYRNLHRLTHIVATFDTHQPLQIFHPMFWIDAQGDHPAPYTEITLEAFQRRTWRPDPEVARDLHRTQEALEAYALHYLQQLAGRHLLMIWPYHAMLGGIGHALVAAIEEAIFFHSVARKTKASFILKGRHTLTENYSALRPEVMVREDDQEKELIEQLLAFDALIVAGQAKSHCVGWTVRDLLSEIRARNASLAGKIYLLEDCTSPVVVPGQADFTEHASEMFRHFAAAGMHIVQSTEPMHSWT
jgi:nicotinamidase-related amidase